MERQEPVSPGNGVLFVTDWNLYFIGPGKTFRVAYAKIVAFQMFSNGIGFTRNASTAKPQYFLHQDAWFLGNLVGLLAVAAQ